MQYEYKSYEHFHQKRLTRENDARWDLVTVLHTSGWTMLKYNSIQSKKKNIPHSSNGMNSFIKRARPAKMMLVEALAPFAYKWLGNVKIHKFTKFESNMPCGSRLIRHFHQKCLTSENDAW